MSDAAEPMICLRCNVPLIAKKAVFAYLGFTFTTPLPRCPVCGQAYISEEFASGKLSQVEATLEDK